MSVKPGKARQLNYFGQIAVDDAHHVITGACSDFADKRDSQCLEQIVELTEENPKRKRNRTRRTLSRWWLQQWWKHWRIYTKKH